MDAVAEIERELVEAGVDVVVSQARAAEVLSLSKRTLQRLIAAGVVECSTLEGSRRVLVRRRVLARLLAQQPQAAASA